MEKINVIKFLRIIGLFFFWKVCDEILFVFLKSELIIDKFVVVEFKWCIVNKYNVYFDFLRSIVFFFDCNNVLIIYNECN